MVSSCSALARQLVKNGYFLTDGEPARLKRALAALAPAESSKRVAVHHRSPCRRRMRRSPKLRTPSRGAGPSLLLPLRGRWHAMPGNWSIVASTAT